MFCSKFHIHTNKSDKVYLSLGKQVKRLIKIVYEPMNYKFFFINFNFAFIKKKTAFTTLLDVLNLSYLTRRGWSFFLSWSSDSEDLISTSYLSTLRIQGFDDYLRRVSDILQQKMTAIAALQGQISYYRGNYPASSTSRSVMSSVSASVSEGGAAGGASAKAPTDYNMALR